MPRYLAFAAALASAVLASPAQAAVTVTIDKSAQQMTVEVDGRPLYQWPVSTGKGGYDTPNGKFKAFRMERDHFSKEWDEAPMPFSIFFTQKGHAIHGSLDVKRLGTPASHGCVRLLPANAEKLFALVEQEGVLNTTVIPAGVAPSGAPAAARRAPGDPSRTARAAAIRATAIHPAAIWPAVLRPVAAPGYGNQYYASNTPPQYAQPQYVRSRFAAAYAQPQYGQPQYGRSPALSIAIPTGTLSRPRGSVFD